MSLRHRAWTTSEIETLNACYAAGLKPSAIGNEMQRSPQSVRDMIKRLRRSDPYISKPDPKVWIETRVVPKSQVVDLYERGFRFSGFSSIGLCIMSRELGQTFTHSHDIAKSPRMTFGAHGCTLERCDLEAAL